MTFIDSKNDNWSEFLGRFAKLRKATINFVVSVCPHRTTRLLRTDFHEI